MRYLLKRLWWYYFALIRAILIILFYPYLYLLLKWVKNYELAHKVRRKGCRILLFLIGIRVKFQGKFSKASPSIIISNHFSELDVFIACAYFPGNNVFVGKAELKNIPLFGIFFFFFFIPIEREKRSNRRQEISNISTRLKEKWNLVIFPEGGILGNFPELHPFMAGAFQFSMHYNVPLQPIVFYNNYILNDVDAGLAQPGTSFFEILEAEKPEHFNDKNAFSTHCYELIAQRLKSQNM